MRMNDREKRYTGKPFCSIKKIMKTLQIPHRRNLYLINPLKIRRVSPYTFEKGSLTLELAMVLPLFLCAVTGLLYVFSFTSIQAGRYRRLAEHAQVLALTKVGISEQDPYICLFDYDMAELPFFRIFGEHRAVTQQVTVRGWSGYTGESFNEGVQEELVYVTPEGDVFHRSRDCTYLLLSVRTASSEKLDEIRNLSGGRYRPCEYCVGNGRPRGTIYITDYGTSYHNTRSCQGLKRTVMRVPLSRTGGLPGCSRCGGGL